MTSWFDAAPLGCYGCGFGEWGGGILRCSNTDMSIVKVAMRSMTSRNWSRSYILCGVVSIDSATHDRHCASISNVAPRYLKH